MKTEVPVPVAFIGIILATALIGSLVMNYKPAPIDTVNRLEALGGRLDHGSLIVSTWPEHVEDQDELVRAAMAVYRLDVFRDPPSEIHVVVDGQRIASYPME